MNSTLFLEARARIRDKMTCKLRKWWGEKPRRNLCNSEVGFITPEKKDQGMDKRYENGLLY